MKKIPILILSSFICLVSTTEALNIPIANQGNLYFDARKDNFGPVSLSKTDTQYSMTNGLVEIGLNDGLKFTMTMNNRLFIANAFGKAALFVNDVASSDFFDPYTFNDTDGRSVSLTKLDSHENVYMSNDGYYAYITTWAFDTSATVYRPDGSHIKFNVFDPSPYNEWSALGSAKTVYSAHNLDSYSYSSPTHPSLPETSGCSTVLSNGYTQTCPEDMASSLTNNLGNTWSWSADYTNYPDGLSYMHKTLYYYTSQNIVSTPQGLSINSSRNTGNQNTFGHYNFTGDGVKPFSINLDADIYIDNVNYASDVNKDYTVTTTYPSGARRLTHLYPIHIYEKEGGHTSRRHNHPDRGLVKWEKIYSPSNALLYSVENSYEKINGITTLINAIYHIDGIKHSVKYSDFNSYNKPQKIVKTASNGQTLTSNITYNITGAPSVDGAIFLIQPETITKINGDGKTLYSEINTYDAVGFLMSKNINGVLTSYTYDKMGNIQTKTDASGNVWTYSNYMSGYPQEILDQNGNKTEFIYDTSGLMLSKTDSKGNKTTYNYDPKSWKIIKETPPIGNPTIYTYSNYYKKLVETQGTNIKTTNYDSLGRIMNVTDEDTKTGKKYVIVHKYDLNQSKSFTSYPCSDISKCTLGTIKQVDILGRTESLIQNTTWTTGA